VTGCDQPLGAATAERLRGAGANVVALNLASGTLAIDAGAVAGAVAQLGGLDVLVISGWHLPALQPAAFEDIDDTTFGGMWEGSMQGMLWLLQAAIPHLRASQGAAIVVLATTGMTGGSQYATAATAFEGQRILMKAAARQLGPEGIRVNAVAVDGELVLADAEAADIHYLAPDVTGDQGLGDVADIVEFLASPAGRHLHGQTLTIDGGRWLAP
jgi:NAD(P)-dependent dehydrogenase (short-subunit alcohol dehydrogenase family)